ncbi:MAG: 4-hydroxy-3-methylbut-2-enyl diphosphate reductase [bacterium]|nr:4-hydroxy-3-methylbut-2-enyl diphosphate reductase [bacterium]MDW8164836.1 4-hydroxy-3-methylbut-2-enyl diphosphate reductase [Candidatus Omnitrophota bacterium]
MKKLIVAKNIGFCFGVKRAVEKTEELLSSLKSIATVGNIVHNPLVMENLKSKGLKVYDSIDMVKDENFLIRSHGIPKRDIEKLKRFNIKIYDMTCPFVKKIHKLVENLTKDKYKIFIVGNKKHPEVLGIKGYGKSIVVVENVKELKKYKNININKLAIIGQTTLTFENYIKTVKRILNILKAKEFLVINTICKVTEDREKESFQIAKLVDAVLVLGGKNSSNTKKIFRICKKECKNTFFVEKFSDLSKINLDIFKNVGVTSGTSTPNFFIIEIIEYLKKIGYKEVE